MWRKYFKHSIICLFCTFFILSCVGNKTKEEDLASAKEKADESFRNALRENLSDVAATNEIAEQELKKAEEKAAQEALAAKEKLKSQIQEALQGTWVWKGQIKISDYRYKTTSSRMVINGDLITDYMDGELMGRGRIREIDIENRKIYYGSDTYLEFDIDAYGNFKLYGDRQHGVLYTKKSSSSSQLQSNYNQDYTFRRDQDVYEYLSSHKFSSDGLTISFRNGGTVMYSNGNQLSNAIMVSNFNSREAILTYTTPYSPGTKMIRVDNRAGTLTDGSGEVYYTRQ